MAIIIEPPTKISELTDRASLITLINDRLKARFPNKPFYFKEKDYKRLLRWQSRKKSYKSYTIVKRSGGTRTIHAPGNRLMSVLRELNHLLEEELRPHLPENVVGFVGGRSIVDGARQHCRRRYVFNTDLKDFFPSIGLHRVKACLGLPPFNLPNRKQGDDSQEGDSIAFELANLMTVPMDVDWFDTLTKIWISKEVAVLPQGAPTSPTLTNLVCRKLDRRLIGLAKKMGLRYTRYADDITFSSDHDVYAPEGEFRRTLDAIIVDEGFRQNLKKVRLQRYTERQMVTGLVVNERVNVVSTYITQIKNLLWIWKYKGLPAAQQIYTEQRQARGCKASHSGTLKGTSVADVLAGKIDFLRMVDGGAVGHFAGREETPEGKPPQPYQSVSARHDRLNAQLKELIAQQVVVELKAEVIERVRKEKLRAEINLPPLEETLQKEKSGQQREEANSQQSPAEDNESSDILGGDDYLYKLIEHEGSED